ncbi:MAG TPA: arginine--tRNA ligase [Candidatus Microsaccharimonas sp.]|nr:arginine--tRNA ligase [Candidatus Microsaccharimonas sp.]
MKSELEQAVATAVKDLFSVDLSVELARPDEQFGDFATNVALQLAKQVGKNPREIAEELRQQLVSDSRLVSVEVAGPGFLNLKLSDAALVAGLSREANKPLAGKTVLVEYSDPNPFKPLHAGHLYTTLVGDTLARLVEHAGAKVTRLNYGGDVGLHVAKSMWAIVRELGGELPEKLHDIAESERPAWLGARYVEGNNAYEDDETAKAEIVENNKRVYQLQADADHDSAFAHIYWMCRQWSYDYFATLYQQLQVVPFDRYIPESEVTQLGFNTVKEQLDKGVFENSDGAVIFDGEKLGLHKRVFINSEGLPTYETKDVGLSLTKWQDYHFDESIIITANEQAQYMQVVIAAINQFAPEPAERTRHLTHGFVKLQGGVKMSSRKGNVITALEILEAAREAGAESGTNPSEETILAAVKYALAKNRMGGDIIYDPKESIALEGNSGPYLQYAHARARSILAKAGQFHAQLEDLEPAERSLLRKITEYNEVLDKAVAERMPHMICTYLYELAQVFNSFYEHNRVIDDSRQNLRLKLIEHYADTLKSGLELLGIHAPDRM